jgi:serine phosphatase RsbU (regulator of sigma subunit)/type II secretory pathway pseudopilin PulG
VNQAGGDQPQNRRVSQGESLDLASQASKWPKTGPWWRPSVVTVVVFVLGLAITAALASVTATVNNRDENRLLLAQVREAGTALAGFLPDLETPIASGAAVAGVTGAQSAPFKKFMSDYVGADGPFTYVSLCGTSGGAPVVLTSVGSSSAAAAAGGEAQCDFLTQKGATSGFSVTGPVDNATRLALEYVAPVRGSPIGVYAEYPLPPGRRAVFPKSFAFSNLGFALYLGHNEQESNLVESTTSDLPIGNPKATTELPFANTVLTLVGTPTEPLAGSLSRRLTFWVILSGVVLTIGATAMTERLVRRRRSAEVLAEENRRLYGEQQTVSSALQRALLPKVTPHITGVEIATRYEAGLEVMDIGGDWFDVITRTDGGFIFVVGDVSGHGVQAAVYMASLHYAIRAYAAEGDSASAILDKLGALLDVERDGHFATVLCGHVDSDRRELRLASAGHFPPILVSQQKGSFVEMVIGPPIGTTRGRAYPTTTVAIPPEGTLLAFTDGLVERKGEVIAIGLAQLRDAVTSGDDKPLTQLLSDVVAQLTPQGSDDDIAILGLRWGK